MTDQRCGTCRHWRTLTINTIDGGTVTLAKSCLYPVPFWATGDTETLPMEGRRCDTWEATDE